MKSEELFIILVSWFLGMLAVGLSICMNKLFSLEFIPTQYDLFALIFFGFAIYFTLKYTGLIKKKDKNEIQKN